jgi:F0F1-type ATP synthase alpha subunit
MSYALRFLFFYWFVCFSDLLRELQDNFLTLVVSFKTAVNVLDELWLVVLEIAEQGSFGDLDADTKHRIERGQRLTELLKQPQYTPYAVWQMYAMLYAATNGAFDKVPVDKIKTAEAALLRDPITSRTKTSKQQSRNCPFANKKKQHTS